MTPPTAFRFSVRENPRIILEEGDRQPGQYPGCRVGEVTGMPEGSHFWDACEVWRAADPPPDVHSVECSAGFVPESRRPDPDL